MKKYVTSALLFCALTSAPALAQSKTAVRPASTTKTTTPAKPATTAKTTTAKPIAAKTAVKPATKPAVKPAAKPATTASKPAAATPAVAVETTPKTVAPAPEPTAVKPKTATNQIFGKGSMAANLGVGLGLGYGYGLSGLHSTPAMSASFEYGIADNLGPGTIGVGGMVGYKSYGWKSSGYKGTWSNIIVAARGTYHYDLFEDPKVDTYAGLSLGVRHERYSDNAGTDIYYSKSSSTYITSGIFVGGRYFFSDKLGAFGEVGYDMSYLKVGLTAKF
ncbi:hypothetical protein [Hymenobacter cavernae]|uniref:Outer membrane protein beta-barrel domain-containing protein n=1 Tax=Hymenobacter cavernae TaxID=2044852 RepID=A0ABQ1UEU3_9BACT|nr:hypothetical protein [Hymenobacter cavernae]GGF17459.1 hypothetical protein GCM10011383_31090 [Hymenobacter cavernae]